MKAIIIKPDTKTVEEVEFNGTLEHMYELLDISSRLVEQAPTKNVWMGNDQLYVDEEGLFRPDSNAKGKFALRIGLQEYIGRALLVGSDDQGSWDTVEAPETPLTFVRELVAFPKQVDAHTTVFDLGEHVVCDFCNKDYSSSDARGGLLFGSYSTCPECVPKIEASAKANNELHIIKEYARPDETFKAFSLRLRGGNNTVVIRSWDPSEVKNDSN